MTTVLNVRVVSLTRMPEPERQPVSKMQAAQASKKEKGRGMGTPTAKATTCQRLFQNERDHAKNRLFFPRLKLKALYRFYAHSIRNYSSVPGAQLTDLQKDRARQEDGCGANDRYRLGHAGSPGS